MQLEEGAYNVRWNGEAAHYSSSKYVIVPIVGITIHVYKWPAWIITYKDLI